MAKVRVAAFSVSVDGFGAGIEQSLDNPLGVRGPELHAWAHATRTFRHMFGQEGGSIGIDEDFAARGFHAVGAWILGRNMFGPLRGAWPDADWKGWWGSNPPYHVPVFVLTHHRRDPIEMEGGTIFHFITGGIEAALERARAAAGDLDVRIGGGVSTIRQYFERGLIDEMHLAVSPVLLGRGEALFAGMDLPALGYRVTQRAVGEGATHIVIGRS